MLFRPISNNNLSFFRFCRLLQSNFILICYVRGSNKLQMIGRVLQFPFPASTILNDFILLFSLGSTIIYLLLANPFWYEFTGVHDRPKTNWQKIIFTQTRAKELCQTGCESRFFFFLFFCAPLTNTEPHSHSHTYRYFKLPTTTVEYSISFEIFFFTDKFF